MTSINTNIAAQTALRTLQSTNAQLDATQGRISTGLKIGEAKDNAAYWSISTTLKSDNQALGTVKDALGLGAASVDVAYTGLNNTLDVLNDIKSKLTAATQGDVDKAAVQAEIAELQKQLGSIANSSSFSGQNWLSVDSDVFGHTDTKQVVSSFTRDSSGTVSIGTIEIDTRSIALVNSSTTDEGILDGGKQGNVNKGGISDIPVGSGSIAAGTGASATLATPAGVTTTEGTVANTLRISLTVNNETFTLDVVGSELNAAITKDNIIDAVALHPPLAAVVEVDGGTNAGDPITFTSKKLGIDTGVAINSQSLLPGAGATGAGAFAEGAVNNNIPGTASVATAAAGFSNDTNGITLDDNDTVSFNVSLDGATSKLVTIDKSTVNRALGTTDGVIDTADNYVKVLNEALSNAGLAGQVTAGKAGSSAITFTGGRDTIAITDSRASQGSNILTIDVTNADLSQVTSFIKSVNTAIDRVTAAASNLGAVASRIELQQTFVSNLMDTIDKGVSGLVDADMNEESTRLQALQVKQQLGVQALSIANQSAQNVLRLFQ